eukprot:8533303-Heterocapsa_arctica.AAC.1
MVLASVCPPGHAHARVGDPTTPCRRSDVRRGARIVDHGLRVEDRESCAQDRPGAPGNCRRLRVHVALRRRVPAPVVDIILFPLNGRIYDIDRSAELR